MQKIHKKTIIDIETNTVVCDNSEIYHGPVVYAGGGKVPKNKVVAPPPPSAEETELQRMSLFTNKLGLEQAGYEENRSEPSVTDPGERSAMEQEYQQLLQSKSGSAADGARMNEINAALYGGPSTGYRKRALTSEEQRQANIEAKIMAKFEADLDKQPGEVSPEQQRALDEMYNVEQGKMDEELARFAVEQSGARGLSLNDTPLAREVLRAKSQGQRELGVARTQGKLNFAEKDRLFNQGMAQWKSDLQQQRFSNLMGLQGQSSNSAIGFMNARANLKPSMFQGASGGGSQVGGIVSGVGAAVGGIAAAF
jgi:hypothetical protein